MLRHAIAPVRRFLKVSHDVVRHARLNSDAKILLLYVHGLPEGPSHKALSEHAAKLGIKGRAYQRAAERVLLSLRHTHRDLHLGVREAQRPAESAAERLRRGVSSNDLRRALAAQLPPEGVRSAVGFLRHRLVQKLPDHVSFTAPAPPPPPPPHEQRTGLMPVTCEGPGDEHVFRPVGDETHCGPCRREAATEAHYARTAQAGLPPLPPHAVRE